MARIRSIKPEFWTSEQVMECSTNARLLFIGLWNFCDDTGRHPASPKQIKALVFPADDFSAEDVRRMLDELASHDLLSFYTVDGKEFFHITGWRHQKIDRPQDPKYPGPDDGHSSTVRRTLATEGIGEEGNREEKKDRGADAPADMAFVGKTIRLKADQYDRWRKAYHAVPDFAAELTKADDYYTENPPAEGKWFFPVSKWLEKAHRDVRSGKADPDAVIYRNVL